MKPGALVGGRYRIVRELGHGGMGVVFEAIQEDLHRTVAIKVLRNGAISGQDHERFVREARAAAGVSSPHIVQILDFSAGNPPYLVMEKLDGETLTERLRSGLLSEAEVLEVARQVLSALELVHERGIIHRDVKASNLFFARGTGTRIHCKLLDFGIAKHAQASRILTEEGSILGTLPYIPPEILLAEGEADPSTDLYALGVCMFEALVGRRPTLRSDYGILDELRQAAPSVRSLAPHVSGPLAMLIDRAVARQPAARFRSAREMRDALDRLAAPPPPSLALASTSPFGPASIAQATFTPGSTMPSASPAPGPHFALPSSAPAGSPPAAAWSPSAMPSPAATTLPSALPLPMGVGTYAHGSMAVAGASSTARAAPTNRIWFAVGGALIALLCVAAVGVGLVISVERSDEGDEGGADSDSPAHAKHKKKKKTVPSVVPTTDTAAPNTRPSGAPRDPEPSVKPSPVGPTPIGPVSTNHQVNPNGPVTPVAPPTAVQPEPKPLPVEVTSPLPGTHCATPGHTEGNVYCNGQNVWECSGSLSDMRACGGRCVTINEHGCAACGQACGPNQICTGANTNWFCKTCDAGHTACPSGQMGNRLDCIDLMNSTYNCGTCGHNCEMVSSTHDGHCVKGVCFEGER